MQHPDFLHDRQGRVRSLNELRETRRNFPFHEPIRENKRARSVPPRILHAAAAAAAA